ncbi:ACYP1-like protein [Mya arenaria]|uniref:acylphosphatase n=1 Tax=Mya arenaria TaxID=6604 RepID=A0ABY7FCB1_MYAAR|nr:ACYP1-like protein [Mya arenaria]
MAAAGRLTSVDFEIFGLVQGVFFRKHTQIQAKALGLVGWCLNTRHNTVQGQVQGPNAKIIEMYERLVEIKRQSTIKHYES